MYIYIYTHIIYIYICDYVQIHQLLLNKACIPVSSAVIQM